MRQELVTQVEEGEYGEAMKALPNDRMRLFVLALLDQPHRDASAAAREAGYANPGGDSSYLRVKGHLLSHDPRVQEAIREEGYKRMGAHAILASTVLVEIAQGNHGAEAKDRLKAAGMILNRVGLNEKTEHKVTVTQNKSETEKVDEIVNIALKLGLDPKALLGQAGYTMPAVSASAEIPQKGEIVQAEYTDVTPSEEGLEDVLG